MLRTPDRQMSANCNILSEFMGLNLQIRLLVASLGPEITNANLKLEMTLKVQEISKILNSSIDLQDAACRVH